MALTRAQLLMGNDSQGAVLPGEVQGVKQGAGILIATDGTISVDASSVVGLVKLNNASAFNGYVWPSVSGSQGQMLTKGTGNLLEWTNGGVFVSGTAPLNPEIGDLWFDCTVGELLVYENCTTGAPRWASASDAGYPVLPANTSASPAFASGSGTNLSPYVTSATTVSSGAVVTIINVVTVIGLAPFQFVTITDLNAYVNGGRFSFSNNVADATGTLVFEIIFTDAPVSPNGTTYTANIRVGNRSAYINAGVSIVDSFYIVSPGTITGNPLIGSTLTYTPGTYNGGAPPITTSWKWYENTTGTLLQTGGATYVTTAAEFGDTVFVVFTATDVNGTAASAPTAQFGPIDRPPFPGPTPPSAPTTTNGTSCNTWSSGSTTLQADNCLQFNKNGGTFGQGPTAVINGDLICTRWAPGALCADAPDGTFIDGCLFDTNYSTCGSLTIDRTPASISFTPVTNIIPGAIATAAAITLSGTNSPTYLSYNSGTSTGSLWKVSINGAAAVSLPATPAATLTAPPGASLVFSFTTGTSPTTSYQLVVDAGQAGSGVSGTFTATTGTAGFPNLPPSLVAGPTSIPGTASGTWADGSTTLTSSGCLEFQVNSGPFSQGPTAVINGDTVTEQWLTTAPCGGAASGTTITGTLTNGTNTNSYSFTVDKVPATFSFTPNTNVNVNSVSTSNTITPTGTNSTAYVSYGAASTGTAIQGSLDGGTTWNNIPASGTLFPINPGQTLAVRQTVGGSVSTGYTAVITIGDGTTGTSATFTATTASTAGFPNLPAALVTGPTTSPGTATGTWADGSTTLTSTSCIEFNVNGGPFGQGPSAVINGDVIIERWIVSPACAGAASGTTITGTLTNGVNTNSYSFVIDTIPAAYSFSDQTGQNQTTAILSNTITPTGFNTTTYLTTTGGTLTSIQASIGGAAFAAIPASGTTMPVTPGQVIQIKGTTGSANSTPYTAILSLGGVASTWTVTTGVATPAIATPTILTPADGSTGVGTAAGITLTSSTYSATGGAGTHASSTWELYQANELVPETTAITAITSAPVFPSTVDRSVRFVSSQNNYLERSVSVNSGRRKWTWSCWVKKSALAQAQGLFVAGGVVQDQINFTLDNGSNSIAFSDVVANTTIANLVTTATYTDCTQWINIVLAVDTASIVSSQRIKLYVNGTQVTSFSTTLYYAQNSDTTMNSVAPLKIGVNGITIGNYLSSYLASVTFVEGLALTPTSFGVLSGTKWVPKDYTGSFGTNGFKLGFATNTTAFFSASSLGKDTSGNNNDFIPYKFFTGNAALDSSIGWFFANPPTSHCYLGLGRGGLAGGFDSNFGGPGGGGGGLIEGSVATTATTLYQLPFQTSSGTYTYDGQTAGAGVSGVFPGGAGGASGSPQSFSGGISGFGGGGGGGAGGAGGSSTLDGGFGGPGLSKSITGTAITYGAGGGGGSSGVAGRTPGPGGPGDGSKFIIAQDASKSLPSCGAALSLTQATTSGITSFTYNTFNSSNVALNQDLLVDTPTPGGTDTGVGGEVTGNYAILNPDRSGVSLSNGNLDYCSTGASGVLASQPIYNGKYYWEVQPRSGVALSGTIGLALSSVAGSGGNPGSIVGSYAYDLGSGQTVTNAVGSAYGAGFGAGDVLGVAFDANDGKLYFAKNNVWQNSSNPLTATNPAFSALTSPPYLPAFGGDTGSNVFSVNFGQRPFVYTAPTGYKVLVENPTILALVLTDAQSLSDFQLGDLVSESPGDGAGVVAAIDLITYTLSISYPQGTWTVGSTVIDNSRTIPVGAPTTNPPDPLNYFLIDSSIDSTVNLTSFTIAKPPLDALRTYFTFVSYKSNATVVTSSPSPWSGFKTGTL